MQVRTGAHVCPDRRTCPSTRQLTCAWSRRARDGVLQLLGVDREPFLTPKDAVVDSTVPPGNSDPRQRFDARRGRQALLEASVGALVRVGFGGRR